MLGTAIALRPAGNSTGTGAALGSAAITHRSTHSATDHGTCHCSTGGTLTGLNQRTNGELLLT